MKHVLTGVHGSTPFGFLTALGVMQVLRAAGHHPKLSWKDSTTGWVAVLDVDVPSDALVRTVYEGVQDIMSRHFEVFKGEAGHNITSDKYAALALGVRGGNRFLSDFLAGLGYEPRVKADVKKGVQVGMRVHPTPLCFVDGSSNQTLFGALRNIYESFAESHVQEALFGPWKYQDKCDKNRSLRLTPVSGREAWNRALVPTKDKEMYTVFGAEILSACSFAFFTMGDDCPAFERLDKDTLVFRWPLWTDSLDVMTTKSLINLDEPLFQLRARSVAVRYQSSKANWNATKPNYFRTPIILVD
jgi:hypothetical protein